MQGMLRGAYLDDQFSDPPIVIVKMQQQQRGKRRPTCARLFLRYGPDLFIVLLVLMLIGWSWLVWDAFKGRKYERIYTQVPEQPMYLTKDEFFPAETFEGIKERLSYGELSDVPSVLNTKNFGTTSGLVVWFNTDGYAQFKAHPKLQDMATFFDSVRVNGTNAFVVNVLASDGKDDDSQVEGAAAGEHVDDTTMLFEFRLRPTIEYVSHQTSVLYVNIPHGMEGGRLQLNPSRVRKHLQQGLNAPLEDPVGSGGHQQLGRRDPPTKWATEPAAGVVHYGSDATHVYTGPPLQLTHITPQENSMVTFRGDVLHKVESFRAPTKERRISLVVEQYKIAPHHYWRTKQFKMSHKL